MSVVLLHCTQVKEEQLLSTQSLS
jgi:hypothetical protein